MIKYYQICIDGIDKSGKDTLLSLLDILGEHKYVVEMIKKVFMQYCEDVKVPTNSRGLLSNIAYSNIYNRDYEYDLSKYGRVLTIYLTVEHNDWVARCKATKEKDMTENDYYLHTKAFDDAVKLMRENGLEVMEYNTSYTTPYEIAIDILNYMGYEGD